MPRFENGNSEYHSTALTWISQKREPEDNWQLSNTSKRKQGKFYWENPGCFLTSPQKGNTTNDLYLLSPINIEIS